MYMYRVRQQSLHARGCATSEGPALNPLRVRSGVHGPGTSNFGLPVLASKNHTGGLASSQDPTDGKVFPQASSRRCPVEVLSKAYLNHLNPNSRDNGK